MAHPNRLQDARVLIFGGTSGMGYALASLVLSQGAYATISGSTQAKVDQKVDSLRSLYPSVSADRVSGYALNLSDTEHLEAGLTDVFEKATQGGKHKINHIAFLSGNVDGIPSIREVTVDTALNNFRVRYLSLVIIAKLLTTGKYMLQEPSSSYTVTGGVNTRRPRKGWALMAAAGAAADGLSRGLAVDLAPIRVNIVEPGAVHTELLQSIEDKNPGVIELFKKAALTETVGEPSDAAEAYAWVMRDRFVNGSIVSTNGGLLLK